ncbi:hypothetical protein NliqN6_5745 [Naganishia liquefaciens]|uniref:Carboxylic ester hydrolase n=1 Tax=Naganishia liquefaciens TaxID=104408 RepID=A0A8H3TYU4_9TREE|nr:hypothetical protein NliqN6_5745 [Naganishia liquefaciens]
MLRQLLYAAAIASVATANNDKVLTSKLGPVVDLGYAAYIGNSSANGIDFFGGIPYIQPPVKDLRWRKPQQLDESWKPSPQRELVDARNFGPICIQQPAVVGVGVEDCVTLNIWRPSNASKDSRLPVVVYIHGGGNYYNSAQGFPMDQWVNVTDGQIIAVSIQYRLGLLGFLASETLMKDGTANGGLLDQRASFEWLQRHVASFGGDPNKITISGESSGGGSVVNHLIWKGGAAASPFQAAIMQSIGNDPYPLSSVYEQCFGNVTHFVGCDQEADVMRCLRSTATSALIAAVNHRPQPLCKYLPIVDGDIIQDIPTKMIAQGRFAKVPVMAGHTTNDGTGFTGSPTAITNDTQLFSALTSSRYTGLSKDTFNKARALYPVSNFSSYYDMAETLVGNTEFTCLDWFIVNKTASYGVPAYNYRWNTPDPIQLASSPWKGSMHTSDLYYLFQGTNSGVSSANAQNVFRTFNATEQPLADEAISYWTSFARTSDPSAKRAGHSPVWTMGPAGRLVIQEANSTVTTGSMMEAVPAEYMARCAFWMTVANEETRI